MGFLKMNWYGNQTLFFCWTLIKLKALSVIIAKLAWYIIKESVQIVLINNSFRRLKLWYWEIVNNKLMKSQSLRLLFEGIRKTICHCFLSKSKVILFQIEFWKIEQMGSICQWHYYIWVISLAHAGSSNIFWYSLYPNGLIVLFTTLKVHYLSQNRKPNFCYKR